MLHRLHTLAGRIQTWHIYALALLLRLGWYLFVLYTNPAGFWLYDSNEYWNIAWNLHEYGTFSRDADLPLSPDYFRTPLYPLLIYPTIGFNPSGNIIPLVQLLADAGVCVLLYKVVHTLTGKTTYGKVAALFYALYFPAMVMSVFVLTENMFLLLLTWFVWLVLRCHLRFTPGRVLVAALMGGLCVMCKPVAFVLVFPCLAFFLWQQGLRWRTWGICLCFTLTFYAVQLPWMYRNQQLFGHGFNSLLGEHLVFGYHACHVYAKANGLDYFEVKDMLLEKYYRTIDFNPYRHPYEYAQLIRSRAYGILWEHRWLFLREHIKECVKFFVKPLRGYVAHQLGRKPYTRAVVGLGLVLQALELLFLYLCLVLYLWAVLRRKAKAHAFVFFLLCLLLIFCQFNTMPYTDARMRFPFDGWMIAAAFTALALLREPRAAVSQPVP